MTASGAIVSLRQQGLDAELVDGKLNDYLYLPGANLQGREVLRPRQNHR